MLVLDIDRAAEVERNSKLLASGEQPDGDIIPHDGPEVTSSSCTTINLERDLQRVTYVGRRTALDLEGSSLHEGATHQGLSLGTINPLHCDKESLLVYLRKLLDRNLRVQNKLGDYLRVAHECGTHARKHSEKIDMDADEFVKTLILMVASSSSISRKRRKRWSSCRGVWVFSYLQNEHQIPFFILVILFYQCIIPLTQTFQSPFNSYIWTSGWHSWKLICQEINIHTQIKCNICFTYMT
ncbi:hypothetical protein Taro_030163 [Colocasia esculenta]|uniref:Uncharacterized protein n=1 Tax=Colocasia esculenta TaxID=4460 RepID=A0A843VFM9_COLES|nr:hypothetical protein [Colocasia esculenta]